MFLVFGLFFIVAFGAVGIQSGEVMFAIIGCGVGFIAFIVGVFNFVNSISKRGSEKKVLREGTTLTGKIVAYQDGAGIVVNGVPPLDLVVEAEYLGETKRFVISSGSYKEQDYPISAYVDFALLGVETAIIKGSVRYY
jgi:hypothetical protein